MAGIDDERRYALIVHPDITTREHLRSLLADVFTDFIETDRVGSAVFFAAVDVARIVFVAACLLVDGENQPALNTRLHRTAPLVVLVDADERLPEIAQVGVDDVLTASMLSSSLSQRVKWLLERSMLQDELKSRDQLVLELQEEQQFTEALQETVAALTQTFDPHHVIALLLDHVGHFVPHDRANIMLFTQDHAHVAYWHRYTPEEVEQLTRVTLSIAASHIASVVRTGNIILIPDTSTDPDWYAPPGSEWIRSYVGVPIRAYDLVIGILNIDSAQPNNFSQKHVRRLQTFAHQAAIAIGNAQLYDTIARDAEKLRALHRATAFLFTPNLFTSNDLLALSEQIARTVVVEFGKVDCGVILVEPETGLLTRLARAGNFQVNATQPLYLDGPGLVPEAIRTNRTIYAPDVTQQPSYAPNNASTRSELVVPLRTPQGVIGVLDLQSSIEDAFSAQEQSLLEMFAERTAVTIENINLYNRIRAHAEDLEQRVELRTLELRSALERERELSELKSRFIARVSHEFRTPLALMNTASDLLKNYGERMSSEQRVEKLNRIQAEVQNLTMMLEDILTISTGAADTKTIFKPDDIDLQKLCADAVNVANEGATHDLRFTYSGSPNAYLDPVWIRRILQNLLSNAMKYSQIQSIIRVRVERRFFDVVIEVEDSGIGIPETDHHRLFEAFHRAGNVEHISGTGLGLAIVRQAVELHGGSVTFRTKLGQGTTFTVILPDNAMGKTHEENPSS